MFGLTWIQGLLFGVLALGLGLTTWAAATLGAPPGPRPPAPRHANHYPRHAQWTMDSETTNLADRRIRPPSWDED
jgi:hypothetical protein